MGVSGSGSGNSAYVSTRVLEHFAATLTCLDKNRIENHG